MATNMVASWPTETLTACTIIETLKGKYPCNCLNRHLCKKYKIFLKEGHHKVKLDYRGKGLKKEYTISSQFLHTEKVLLMCTKIEEYFENHSALRDIIIFSNIRYIQNYNWGVWFVLFFPNIKGNFCLPVLIITRAL